MYGLFTGIDGSASASPSCHLHSIVRYMIYNSWYFEISVLSLCKSRYLNPGSIFFRNFLSFFLSILLTYPTTSTIRTKDLTQGKQYSLSFRYPQPPLWTPHIHTPRCSITLSLSLYHSITYTKKTPPIFALFQRCFLLSIASFRHSFTLSLCAAPLFYYPSVVHTLSFSI